MRFLITILILIISFNCVAQFPNNPTQGAVQTNNQFLGAITAQKGIVAGTFTDTTAANSATYIKTVPFIMISCTTPNAIISATHQQPAGCNCFHQAVVQEVGTHGTLAAIAFLIQHQGTSYLV